MRKSISALKSRRRQRLAVDVLEDRQLLSTISVNTTADDTTAASTMSLREAIEVSNGTVAVSSLSTQQQAQVSGAVGSTNTIDFNIPTTDSGYDATTGVWTIALKSGLPTISTNAAIIDGYTQPGAAENMKERGDNAKLAIAISGTGAGTIVGLTIGQSGSEVRGLDVENFGYAGILVTAAGNAQVSGCFIGTDPSGETAAPNATGLIIQNSSNLIGGPNVDDRNVISGNAGYGILIPDQSGNPLNIEPTGNVIENSYIGTDATGTTALGNAYSGIYDSGSGNTYGSNQPNVGNVISGNKAGGLKAGGSITIEGNFVGTDATGEVALGNLGGFPGIYTSQDIGGPPVLSTIITNNVVSDNNSGGIEVDGGSQESQATCDIASNRIGTDANGTVAMGNGGVGLNVASVANASIINNVISANHVGLQYSQFDTLAQNGVIAGNMIGTDVTGQVALGNTGPGIILENAQTNVIGAAGTKGSANVIAYNGGDGIDVEGGEQDNLSGNSIFNNGGSGIKLTSQANHSAVPPALTFAAGAGSGTLTITMNAAPNTAYIVEYFSNLTAPAPGHEQGQTFAGAVTITTDGSGQGTYSVIKPNSFYSAFATDPSGNTSAFVAATTAQALPTSQTSVSSTANPSTVGQSVTFTAVVSAPSFQGTPTGTVTFTVDGQAQTPVTLALVGGSDEAQFTTSTLTAGSHTVSASYSGDKNVSPSGGSPLAQTVNAPALKASTTSVQSSVNPSTTGELVTFTAIVSAPTFQGTLTGTVTFTIDGHAEAPIQLTLVGASGDAAFSTSTLSEGLHTVSASYSGDSNVSASSGSLPTQSVQAPALLPSTTTLESSHDPSTLGQAVTFTAVVTAPSYEGTPSGKVTFTIDGQAQTPVNLGVVGDTDEARFTTSTLSAGSHTVSASYSGDSNVSASTGSLPTQTVNAPVLPTTTTTLASSVNPSTVGQPVIFTAVVSPSGSTGTPSGSVTFTIDGVSVAPVPLQLLGGSEQAALSIASLAEGRHTISAAYTGDSSFAASAVTSPLVEMVKAVTSPAVDGPKVESVQRFGIHMQPTVLEVRFNEAIDPVSAVNLRNYRITGPAGHSVQISSAVFDAATNTVTLRPADRINLHHTYHLTLVGVGPDGIKSTQGELLDGANTGSADSNYTATLTWRNVVFTPAEIKKYIDPLLAKPAGALNHHFQASNRPRLR